MIVFGSARNRSKSGLSARRDEAFVDLNDGLRIGEVSNVADDLRRMLPGQSRLEAVCRVEVDDPYREVRCLRAVSSGLTQQSLAANHACVGPSFSDERHVRVAIVIVIESRTGCARINYAQAGHGLTPAESGRH